MDFDSDDTGSDDEDQAAILSGEQSFILLSQIIRPRSLSWSEGPSEGRTSPLKGIFQART